MPKKAPKVNHLPPTQRVAIIFTYDEWSDLHDALKVTLAEAERPKGWRDSEWAMTRAAFERTATEIRRINPENGPIVLTYDEWCQALYQMTRVPKGVIDGVRQVFDTAYLTLYDRIRLSRGDRYDDVRRECESNVRATEVRLATEKARLAACKPNVVALAE